MGAGVPPYMATTGAGAVAGASAAQYTAYSPALAFAPVQAAFAGALSEVEQLRQEQRQSRSVVEQAKRLMADLEALDHGKACPAGSWKHCVTCRSHFARCFVRGGWSRPPPAAPPSASVSAAVPASVAAGSAPASASASTFAPASSSPHVAASSPPTIQVAEERQLAPVENFDSVTSSPLADSSILVAPTAMAPTAATAAGAAAAPLAASAMPAADVKPASTSGADAAVAQVVKLGAKRKAKADAEADTEASAEAVAQEEPAQRTSGDAPFVAPAAALPPPPPNPLLAASEMIPGAAEVGVAKLHELAPPAKVVAIAAAGKAAAVRGEAIKTIAAAVEAEVAKSDVISGPLVAEGVAMVDSLPADVLPPGTTVKLVNLTQHRDFLDNVGVVEQYSAKHMGYRVKLGTGPASGRTLAFKCWNVRQIVRSARVVGTWDRPELEGALAPVASYDTQLGRYRVRGVTKDGSVLAIKPENVMLPPRTMVTVKSVSHRPSLNGRKGRIVGIENAKEMYTVRLDNNEHVKLCYGAVLA